MVRDIDYGYALPGYSKYRDPSSWVEIAQAAEEAGFSTLWMGDHVTIPEELQYREYQFGTPDWAKMTNPTLDVFQTFSHLMAVTDEIHFGTNICVVPLRHPVLLAKQALTLDAISDGRFEFGVGSGWLSSEFEVLDVPPEERGSRTDEFLRMFERICEEGAISWDGPHHQFDKTGFYPIPEDDMTIWVGGDSGAAFRRVAEFGDGWTIVGRDPGEVADSRDRIMNAWRDYDRDGEPLISARQKVDIGGEPRDNVAAGTPDEVAEQVAAYREAGTMEYIMGTTAETVEAELEQIRRFGDDVME